MKLSQAFEFLEDLTKSYEDGVIGFSEKVQLVWAGGDAEGQKTEDGKDGCWDIEFEPTIWWLNESDIKTLFKVANKHNLGVRMNEQKWQIYHYSDAEELNDSKAEPENEESV